MCCPATYWGSFLVQDGWRVPFGLQGQPPSLAAPPSPESTQAQSSEDTVPSGQLQCPPAQIGETVSEPHAPPAVPGEHVGCQSKQPQRLAAIVPVGHFHVLPTHWASVSESPHSPPAVPLAHSGAVPRQPRASIVAPSCADASPPTFAG